MINQAKNRTFQPTTFLERGVSVPFTAPVLAGARVRPAERFGLEMIVPNPSGGRGSYVLPWTEMRSLCRPTVHDVQLTERIAALCHVTPATIRRAAKETASEGFAGRAAGAAAGLALAAERDSTIMTNFQLLIRVVQQAEPPGGGTRPPEAERPAELERRAKRTIAAIAPRLAQDAVTIGANLESLAMLYEPIGLGPRAAPARLPHAVGLLKLLRQEAEALAPDMDEQTPELIRLLVSTADLTVSLAESELADARSRANDVVGLLASWREDAAALTRQLARADWMLDGWDRICQLWALDPRPSARRDALEEIVSLLPVIPREVGDWTKFEIAMDPLIALRRMIPGHHDWRTGTCVQDTIARNETLLAA